MEKWDYDTFVVARRVASAINSRESADRRLNRRCFVLETHTLDRLLLCQRLFAPSHPPFVLVIVRRSIDRPVSCPRMNRDARLRVINRKAILRLFITVVSFISNPRNAKSEAFHFGNSISASRYERDMYVVRVFKLRN